MRNYLRKTSDHIFVGLISGTSMDAVDAVLVDFSQEPFSLIATHSEGVPTNLKQHLQELVQPGYDEINRCGQLDRQMGSLFAQACNNLIEKAQVKRSKIDAIGSHGQTIRHQPNLPLPFTLQIGDPNTIAALTGITTIADFRRRDMVKGGQGAPLTPAFHKAIFSDEQKNRVIVNIGGIANLTFLHSDNKQSLIAFDCGPGNTLLDACARRHLSAEYDQDGQWACGGKLHDELLARLLGDPYFQLSPPKSTGREYFNIPWLEKKMSQLSISPIDLQTTLVDLTGRAICNAINQYGKGVYEVLVCGGGVHNTFLMHRLKVLAKPHTVLSTESFGVDPDWVEAIAFAWLAKRTLTGEPGNLPTVTGASEETILGGIYLA